ncbi:hypothetical protein GWK47_015379 [Chionoecetes opilio]|uniref:Uncharacterized protein n=1 Tax=Chionoecetes opilio TaxID=41210 RepID=A0A8J4XU38_CHIOP|nr:hypothetical protein GWK47_015379 [Chionoecetes opilio]
MGSDVMRPKRSSLTAKNLEKLVFLKGNMNLLKGWRRWGRSCDRYKEESFKSHESGGWQAIPLLCIDMPAFTYLHCLPHLTRTPAIMGVSKACYPYSPLHSS